MGFEFFRGIIITCKGGFIKQAMDHAMTNPVQPLAFGAAP